MTIQRGTTVERATEDRTGRIDRYGKVLNWYTDAGNNGIRSGWRVQWDYGGCQILPEHELKVVTR